MHNPVPDSNKRSAASAWRALARFIEVEAEIGRWAMRGGRLRAWIYEFARIGIKQAWACLFGGPMVSLVVATTGMTHYNFECASFSVAITSQPANTKPPMPAASYAASLSPPRPAR